MSLSCPADGDLNQRSALEAMLDARAVAINVGGDTGLDRVEVGNGLQRVMALLVAGFSAPGSSAIPMHLDAVSYARLQANALERYGVKGHLVLSPSFRADYAIAPPRVERQLLPVATEATRALLRVGVLWL